MTDSPNESVASAASQQAVTPRRPGPLARGWEWLWRGAALRAARTAQRTDPALGARQRARIAVEVAEQVLGPPSPWLSGSAHHIAATLFADAIVWSLRAVATEDDADLAPAELLTRHEGLLLEATGGRDSLELLRSQLLERSFEQLSTSPEAAELAARELRVVAKRLQELAEPFRATADKLIVQRLLRSGGVLLLLVVGLLGASLLREWHEQTRDIARGKPWVASSSYEVVCASPLQHCGSPKDYFFHTQEEQNPWLEIDLQRPEQFSGVHVTNRQDCCDERAVPLVVEVSSDHQKWREVAKKGEPFADFRQSFTPQTARWIRFRVARRSLLHLGEVRVLR